MLLRNSLGRRIQVPAQDDGSRSTRVAEDTTCNVRGLPIEALRSLVRRVDLSAMSKGMRATVPFRGGCEGQVGDQFHRVS